MLSPDTSGEVILGVGAWLESTIGINLSDYTIRKLAHFLEYALLGVEVMAFAWRFFPVYYQTLVNGLFFGLAAAVIDESIQIVSGRGAMVQDILLDFCGFLMGMGVVLMIYGVWNGLKRRRGPNE